MKELMNQFYFPYSVIEKWLHCIKLIKVSFDSERLFVNVLQQMVEGWCEKVNSILLNIRNEAENKRKE